MRAGGDLECPDVTPAEVHPVVSEVRAAAEIVTGDQPVAGADGQFRLYIRVPDRHHEFVGIARLFEHFLLNRRILLVDDDGWDRMRNGIGQFSGALGVVFPTKHFVDDVHVTE